MNILHYNSVIFTVTFLELFFLHLNGTCYFYHTTRRGKKFTFFLNFFGHFTSFLNKILFFCTRHFLLHLQIPGPSQNPCCNILFPLHVIVNSTSQLVQVLITVDCNFGARYWLLIDPLKKTTPWKENASLHKCFALPCNFLIGHNYLKSAHSRHPAKQLP